MLVDTAGSNFYRSYLEVIMQSVAEDIGSLSDASIIFAINLFLYFPSCEYISELKNNEADWIALIYDTTEKCT